MEALAYLCAHLAELRSLLPDEDLSDRLQAAVRGGGQQIDDLLERIHAELQANGEPLGIWGSLPGAGTGRGLQPAGIGTQSALGPDEVVYLCPTGACSRYWWPRARATVPQCEIDRQSLRRDRL
ncbi:hypothetical protein EV643_107234 [Kribbella sp. VKM Ac-2527]|uniref:Uncharacterized protein n=2 Tax=Kribbella caucasensis TaxID=2512215 RepID=A0A4R6KHJ4_9ACTN|nr:hypothetical protein EV643_107234 [Kribbella sp. VKM Ac-2527]